MQTTVTPPSLRILIHTFKYLILLHIVTPSTTHTFTTFPTHGSCPPAQSHPHSLHIVLFVYAQCTVCQPILFYQHQCRSNYPPILYKLDIGKQSDVMTWVWVMLFPCSQYLGGWVFEPPLFQILRFLIENVNFDWLKDVFL